MRLQSSQKHSVKEGVWVKAATGTALRWTCLHSHDGRRAKCGRSCDGVMWRWLPYLHGPQGPLPSLPAEWKRWNSSTPNENGSRGTQSRNTDRLAFPYPFFPSKSCWNLAMRLTATRHCDYGSSSCSDQPSFQGSLRFQHILLIGVIKWCRIESSQLSQWCHLAISVKHQTICSVLQIALWLWWWHWACPYISHDLRV